MKALARIVAKADGRGGTRLATLYGEAPLLARQTGPGEVHLVGGAAGPLGGDELFLELHVGRGARLTLRTVAASIALPGPGPSLFRITASVEGWLDWLPEPLVAAGGCDHVTESIVELGPDATMRWRDELVCGRYGEEPGDLTVRTTVRRNGRTLYRQDLAVGPRAPGWAGPAGLGGARAVGSFLVVESSSAIHHAETDGDAGRGFESATMPLTAGAAVTTAIARDALLLRVALSRPRGSR